MPRTHAQDDGQRHTGGKPVPHLPPKPAALLGLQRTAGNAALASLMSVQRAASIAGQTTVKLGVQPAAGSDLLLSKWVYGFDDRGPITLTGTKDEIVEWLDDHSAHRIGWKGKQNLHIWVRRSESTSGAKAAKTRFWQGLAGFVGGALQVPAAEMLAENAQRKDPRYVLSISRAAPDVDNATEVNGSKETSGIIDWAVELSVIGRACRVLW